ncbi:MAG TPA: hypothetical protein VM597_05605 [Gemmataceae bacterium]|jgi:hypothetical protein|nr:hypothetical protein [Gemmataceae bacterium]
MPRRDDEYDDPRDRSDDGYDDGGGGSRRSGRLEEARQRVSMPGMFLVVFGLLSVFITVLYIALLWIAPDTVLKGQYEMMKDFTKNQPQGMPPYEEYVKSQQVQSSGVGVLQLIGGVLIAVGGMKMRVLQSYGLAVTGSIMAIIPLCTNQCCCLSMPFGIWALAVLLNADVKAAFGRQAAY